MNYHNKNKPYVKIISDLTGEIMNPITKSNPYLHPFKIPKVKQPKNNKKGIRVLIMNLGKGVIIKYHIIQQYLKNRTIFHYVEKKMKRQQKHSINLIKNN